MVELLLLAEGARESGLEFWSGEVDCDNDRYGKSGTHGKVVNIDPVAKTTKGYLLEFQALVVVGDGNGRVGTGVGKRLKSQKPFKGAEEAKIRLRSPLSGPFPMRLWKASAGSVCQNPLHRGRSDCRGPEEPLQSWPVFATFLRNH